MVPPKWAALRVKTTAQSVEAPSLQGTPKPVQNTWVSGPERAAMQDPAQQSTVRASTAITFSMTG